MDRSRSQRERQRRRFGSGGRPGKNGEGLDVKSRINRTICQPIENLPRDGVTVSFSLIAPVIWPFRFFHARLCLLSVFGLRAVRAALDAMSWARF